MILEPRHGNGTMSASNERGKPTATRRYVWPRHYLEGVPRLKDSAVAVPVDVVELVATTHELVPPNVSLEVTPLRLRQLHLEWEELHGYGSNPCSSALGMRLHPTVLSATIRRSLKQRVFGCSGPRIRLLNPSAGRESARSPF